MRKKYLEVLLVEDNVAEARLLQELLREARNIEFQVTHTKRMQAALQAVAQDHFDVILLDLTLPDSTGLDSVDTLLTAAPTTPILVLTNTNDEELALATVRHGAQDFLIKRHLQPELLNRAIYYAIERKHITEALHSTKDNLEQEVQNQTAELRHAKDLAQTTLKSIGEAVITTDAQGYVELLNPVAERLTGWTLAQAQAQPLDRVLQVVDEYTREPMTDLIKTVLLRQDAVEYPNLLLLDKDKVREIAVEVSISPIRNRQKVMQGLVLVCRNVTPARQLTQQLQWQADHDTLTNLINRSAFERHLSAALERVKGNAVTTDVLCYLDLDQFKIVNDTCGHAAGDDLLRRVATVLQQDLEAEDCLARLGGDEFGIMLRGCSLAQGEQLAQKMVERIRAIRFTYGDRMFQIGASIGVMAIDGQLEDVTLLLQTADTAMYVAKAAGRNRVQIYHPNDLEFQKHQGEIQWVSQITSAIAENRFRLYAQLIEPIIPHSKTQPHYEILLRLQDSHGHLVRPGQFLPAAERFALMPQLDRWVIRTLFSQLAQRPNARSQGIYAINLSGASFNDDTFLAFLQEQLAAYQIPPEMICFEITETVAIANLNNAVQIINHLRQLGCQFSLDDFGTGMSSLTYLKTLPVDYVKIDGAFIRNLTTDPVNTAMVAAISQICKVMGLKIIAECVEHRKLVAQLWDLGVSYVQGYGIGKPCPLEWVIGHAHDSNHEHKGQSVVSLSIQGQAS
ncbi:MAG: EAL domain-containing protein [Cyanobacteria bacterium P01_G01_bin.54]